MLYMEGLLFAGGSDKRMWFSSCEDCNQPLKGPEADQRGLHLLALLSLCVQQQAGCCATGTGESHSSCTKATWASFVFMLTQESSQDQLNLSLVNISSPFLMKEYPRIITFDLQILSKLLHFLVKIFYFRHRQLHFYQTPKSVWYWYLLNLNMKNHFLLFPTEPEAKAQQRRQVCQHNAPPECNVLSSTLVHPQPGFL